MRAAILSLFLLALPLLATNADVIRLVDGTVFLGTAGVQGSEGIRIRSFGDEQTIPQSDILFMGQNAAALAESDVEIRLPDGSVLKGRIRDYDEEIGLLLETYFGTITLPPKGIREIVDPMQRTRYSGVPFQAGLAADYRIPFAELGKNFDNSYAVRANAEWNTYLARGLYVGLEIGYAPMDYVGSANVTYNAIDLEAYGMYRYLGMQLSKGFLNRFIPFVLAGGGVSYIAVHDERSTAPAERRNELSAILRGAGGVDVRIVRMLSLRVEGGVSATIQSALYPAAYGGLGITVTP